VNIVIVAPLMVILAVRSSPGSRRSWLCLIGFLAFTAYNYAVYTFSIHFGQLFRLGWPCSGYPFSPQPDAWPGSSGRV
jgi:hypothetical protein